MIEAPEIGNDAGAAAVDATPGAVPSAPEASTGSSVRADLAGVLKASRESLPDSGTREPVDQTQRQRTTDIRAALQKPASQVPTAEQPRATPPPTGDRYLDEIHAFHGAKDASGNLTNPHFDACLGTMLELARMERAEGRIPTLASLYEEATWMNPKIRASLIEQHTARPAPAQQAPARQASPHSIRGALQQAMGANR